ncbi:TolC family protein [Mariprofundus sp. EBB-1]|uniref:TolC family protein n=1 Tax=Mariprofundus sp. EBB-1 TaxID=2650971 RepID=UPI000EF28E10|nr:TolC family protein [Mariprofundus sp. EBB-1]RLL51531.1 TolC family protein [Mariprofundus sp. EBB-1]
MQYLQKVQHTLAMIILIAIPSTATAAASPLILQQAESLALQHNPALAAVGKQAEAMAAIPSQVGSLPDPKVSLKAINLPVDSFSTTQENMTQMQLGFSQGLPFPGKLGLKSEAAEHIAAAALQNRQEFRLVLLRNTRIHWWNLVYLDKAISIIRRNQDLLRNLVKIAETKYTTGKGLQQDVLLAQLELSKLLERELKLQGARQREAGTLNALLGRAASTEIVIASQQPGAVTFIKADVEGLKQWAREHRPMLLAMDYRVQAADSMLALAQKNYYPDFNIGAAYGFRQGINPASRKSRPDFASIMLTMTVPLYSGSKQDKAVDQRMAERARAQFSHADAANRVDADIDAAASDLSIAHNQVVLFEKGILPQARLTTASMLAGYQVNKVDFLNLVRAQLSEFNTDIQYWRQISALHQAEARLAAAAGKESLQ